MLLRERCISKEVEIMVAVAVELHAQEFRPLQRQFYLVLTYFFRHYTTR